MGGNEKDFEEVRMKEERLIVTESGNGGKRREESRRRVGTGQAVNNHINYLYGH